MTVHTSRAYEQELGDLKNRLLAMGARCEELIHLATQALATLDVDLAKQVEGMDRTLNQEEMAIDENTVSILALRQPVGKDLRFLVTVLKVVTDLERIGDEAVNMAERAEELAGRPPIDSLTPQLQKLAAAASKMVRKALDSFVEEDEAMARTVLSDDDEVDEMYGQLRRDAVDFMRADPSRIEDGLRFAWCAKYIERVADHATNIAEMVIYLVCGEDVRHHAGGAPQVDHSLMIALPEE